MIRCFFDDADSLLPRMHTALQKGDLAEVTRLVHRLKGTIVYLGAEPAGEATLRVEKFVASGVVRPRPKRRPRRSRFFSGVRDSKAALAPHCGDLARARRVGPRQ